MEYNTRSAWRTRRAIIGLRILTLSAWDTHERPPRMPVGNCSMPPNLEACGHNSALALNWKDERQPSGPKLCFARRWTTNELEENSRPNSARPLICNRFHLPSQYFAAITRSNFEQLIFLRGFTSVQTVLSVKCYIRWAYLEIITSEKGSRWLHCQLQLQKGSFKAYTSLIKY